MGAGAPSLKDGAAESGGLDSHAGAGWACGAGATAERLPPKLAPEHPASESAATKQHAVANLVVVIMPQLCYARSRHGQENSSSAAIDVAIASAGLQRCCR